MLNRPAEPSTYVGKSFEAQALFLRAVSSTAQSSLAQFYIPLYLFALLHQCGSLSPDESQIVYSNPEALAW